MDGGIGLFMKMASTNKGQSDLSSFGINYDTNVSSPSKRALYQTQGTLSLSHYLKDFPKMNKEFEPFAYKDFMGGFGCKCHAMTEFKDFFVKVADYMACFSSGSKDIKVEMIEKSEKLFRAMS